MMGTGQIITMPDGRKATVVGYYSSKGVFVEYPDGAIDYIRVSALQQSNRR